MQLMKPVENGPQEHRTFSDRSGSWINPTIGHTSSVVGARERVRVLVSNKRKSRRKERGERDCDGIYQKHQPNRGLLGKRKEKFCDGASVLKCRYLNISESECL